MDELLLTPPIAAVVFLAIACAIYKLGAHLGARGDPASGKHLPYTGGELPLQGSPQQSYQAFFRLALLFSILHVATLVLSTLPRGVQPHRTAIIYLGGIAISVFVLTDSEG